VTDPTPPTGTTLSTADDAISGYWNIHTLGFQYLRDREIEVGSREFFDYIRPWMNPYKFPWIMERIEQAAAILGDGHLLEVGCGLVYDSLEFLRRGVRVTATDLTLNAVQLTRRHFELERVEAEDVRVESVLDLSFQDDTFDAVWANGVLHHTGDMERAVQEVRRVLKPGGRAIISHFYRRPSWMYWVSRLGRENIEFKEKDPPVTDFCAESEILSMFRGFRIASTSRDHYRALPIARRGLKAALYTRLFKPMYNTIPAPIAERLAYKFSVTAIKE
jgi:2-polyprenyl-3-methyl-5-hydroxy-6-metoxy-1,4-benzoquinol methylase